MPVARLFRLSSACLVAGTLVTGCVTTREQAGTFTSGGSGTYGSPAPGAELPPETTWLSSLFGGKKPDPAKSVQLHMAYAMNEVNNGNRAGARNATEEQRASYAAARKSYEHVLTINEKSVDAVIGLARLDEASGRVADAEQGFQKAVRLDSNSPRSLDALGQFYAGQRRWSEAIPTLQRALSASPDDKDIHYHYGIALARSGQLEQAQTHLVDAVGPATAHYNMGVVLYEQGELVASEEHFSAALLENPRLEPAQKWLTDVRREMNERSRVAQARPQTGERPTVVPTGGRTPSPGSQPTSSKPANGRQSAPSANQPRGIQQTSGTSSDEASPADQRPAVPVSPLPRQ